MDPSWDLTKMLLPRNLRDKSCYMECNHHDPHATVLSNSPWSCFFESSQGVEIPGDTTSVRHTKTTSWWFFTNPSEKYAQVKLHHFENSKKYLKPPPTMEKQPFDRCIYCASYIKMRWIFQPTMWSFSGSYFLWKWAYLFLPNKMRRRMNEYAELISLLPGWWFQPIWKILVKMGIFPK